MRLGKATNPPTASVSLTLTAGRTKVGTASLKVPAGKARVLKVKLNKKGRARLRRGRRLKVSLKIVATGVDDAVARQTRPLTIKRRRLRR